MSLAEQKFIFVRSEAKPLIDAVLSRTRDFSLRKTLNDEECLVIASFIIGYSWRSYNLAGNSSAGGFPKSRDNGFVSLPEFGYPDELTAAAMRQMYAMSDIMNSPEIKSLVMQLAAEQGDAMQGEKMRSGFYTGLVIGLTFFVFHHPKHYDHYRFFATMDNGGFFVLVKSGRVHMETAVKTALKARPPRIFLPIRARPADDGAAPSTGGLFAS